MTNTEENKNFIKEMIGEKRRLEDYPDRFTPDLVMYEPASLPFGGVYQGLEEFKSFYPLVRDFYDFSQFRLSDVRGDGDLIFAIIDAVIAGNRGNLRIVEQFRFEEKKIVEVRLHICDDKDAAETLQNVRRK